MFLGGFYSHQTLFQQNIYEMWKKEDSQHEWAPKSIKEFLQMPQVSFNAVNLPFLYHVKMDQNLVKHHAHDLRS